MKERLLTAKEVADIFGVHENSVYRWAESGKIPCVKIPERFIRFRSDVVNDIVDAGLLSDDINLGLLKADKEAK